MNRTTILGIMCIISLMTVVVYLSTTLARPPKVPHTVEDRIDCVLCHQLGLSREVVHNLELPERSLPITHRGYGPETCLTCHK